MIFIDGHVHIWPKYNLKSFFDSVFLNFSAVASENSNRKAPIFVLFLTETPDENGFSMLTEIAKKEEVLSDGKERISFKMLEDRNAVEVSNSTCLNKVIIVPGQQIVTAEKIEVIGIFMKSKVRSGLKLSRAVDEIQSNNGVIILPWGVGKWLGKRGRYIEKFLMMQKDKRTGLLLGDNGNRPWFWPNTGIKRWKDRFQLKMISGSDPLNVLNGYARVGSFGTILDVQPKRDKTVLQQIKDELTGDRANLIPYGRAQSGFSFLYSQVLIRLP